jgi:hypothetical protein
VEETLISPFPLPLAMEKLHGFIADHQARIRKIQGNRLEMEIEVKNPLRSRRRSDRPVCFDMVVVMSEDKPATEEKPARSRFGIKIAPKSSRERRRREIAARLEELLASFRSYLAISEAQPPHKYLLWARLRDLFQKSLSWPMGRPWLC